MSGFGWIFKPAPHLRSWTLVLGLCFAMVVSHVNAQSNADQPFGKVHFPVACSAAVQDEFDPALAMLHTFSFPAAAKTFMAVAQKDPDCAMAYWGIAATAIGSLYGGRPGPAALQGEQAIEKAKAIGGRDPRERDYVAAVEVFYKGADTLDYATRLRSYANALKQLHRQYPEDREAEIFYAYALSALGTPTDQTFRYQLRGAAILEKLYAELPDHPGVLHYLLHAYDNTPYASRGLTAALRLAKAAPLVAACAAISRSHLQSHGPLARIDRHESSRRSSRRSLLQAARDGFPCPQLFANWAGRSCQRRGRPNRHHQNHSAPSRYFCSGRDGRAVRDRTAALGRGGGA